MNSINSNWTLRFPRTGREAFGHQVKFEQFNQDKYVFIACLVLCAFFVGAIVGGLIK